MFKTTEQLRNEAMLKVARAVHRIAAREREKVRESEIRADALEGLATQMQNLVREAL